MQVTMQATAERLLIPVRCDPGDKLSPSRQCNPRFDNSRHRELVFAASEGVSVHDRNVVDGDGGDYRYTKFVCVEAGRRTPDAERFYSLFYTDSWQTGVRRNMFKPTVTMYGSSPLGGSLSSVAHELLDQALLSGSMLSAHTGDDGSVPKILEYMLRRWQVNTKGVTTQIYGERSTMRTRYACMTNLRQKIHLLQSLTAAVVFVKYKDGRMQPVVITPTVVDEAIDGYFFVTWRDVANRLADAFPEDDVSISEAMRRGKVWANKILNKELQQYNHWLDSNVLTWCEIPRLSPGRSAVVLWPMQQPMFYGENIRTSGMLTYLTLLRSASGWRNVKVATGCVEAAISDIPSGGVYSTAPVTVHATGIALLDQALYKPILKEKTTMAKAKPDPREVEALRMKQLEEINANPRTREELEALFGQAWDTAQLTEDFEVRSFIAPYCVVTRKSDGAVGSLCFQHRPRFYFDFVEDTSAIPKL